MNKERQKNTNTAETNLRRRSALLYDGSNQIYFKHFKASGCYMYHQFHI